MCEQTASTAHDVDANRKTAASAQAFLISGVCPPICNRVGPRLV